MSALLVHHLVNFKRIHGINDEEDMGALSPAARREKSRASSAGTATRTDSARTGSVDSARFEEDEKSKQPPAAPRPQIQPIAQAPLAAAPKKKRVGAKQNSKKRLRRQNTEGVKRQKLM